MSILIKDCVGNVCDRFATLTKKDGKIDAKMTFCAFSMDVIPRCAFGVKIDSLGKKVMYPDFVSFCVEGLSVTKEMTFFFDLLANILQERSQSEEKFIDFIELADESISDFMKEVDGKTVPLWSREEIDEIVKFMEFLS
ncbi:hypothetical protein DAPPUDRAFT_311607 [Daphnia pulex]|uniref:Uncharacterized protein n=1 Tax=Daphnia pulex TaxID=6669 RepID=E9FXD8_DAPPU|nr:hypothetical protein DAPPUDRAFT_311607 [Daphnia pulex]|eukprot:EFX88285.1 hypothetical protein DAPPUDRAFT_311607 [Daphnia pulex]